MLKYLQTLVFLIVLFCFSNTFSQDVPPPPNYGKAKTEITPQKKEVIKKIIGLSTTLENEKKSFQRTIDYFKKQPLPSTPQGYWEEVEKDFNTDLLLDKYIEVYDKYFTYSDLKKLLKFYNTSVGKKFITTSNDFNNEIKAVGTSWQTQTLFEVTERMKK